MDQKHPNDEWYRYVNAETWDDAVEEAKSYQCSTNDLPWVGNNIVPFRRRSHDPDAYLTRKTQVDPVEQIVPGGRRRAFVAQSRSQRAGQAQRQVKDWVGGVGADIRQGKLLSEARLPRLSDLKNFRMPAQSFPGAGFRLRPV